MIWSNVSLPGKEGGREGKQNRLQKGGGAGSGKVVSSWVTSTKGKGGKGRGFRKSKHM